MILLIDGNHLAWRWYMSRQNAQFKTQSGVVTTVLYGCLKSSLKICRDLAQRVELTIFCWDSGASFRKKVYKDYKADRDEQFRVEKESVYNQIKMTRAFLNGLKVPQFSVYGLEGDDCLGLLANDYVKQGYRVFISSGDTDLYQLLTDDIFLHDGKKGVSVTKSSFEKDYGISPLQWIDIKVLKGKKGETPGVKGIGEKTAVKMIKKAGTVQALKNGFDWTQFSNGVQRKRPQFAEYDVDLWYDISTVLKDSENLGEYEEKYEEAVKKMYKNLEEDRRLKRDVLINMLNIYELGSLVSKIDDLARTFQLELV